MASGLIRIEDLIGGPLLLNSGGLPFSFGAVFCDVRPRMIAKGQVGRGYRAVARNGRILLASNRSLADLAGRVARIRIQPWHRIFLPGEDPELCGLLLHVRCPEPRIQNPAGEPRPHSQAQPGNEGGEEPLYRLQLVSHCRDGYDLTLDVGGGMVLAVVRNDEGLESPLARKLQQASVGVRSAHGKEDAT